MNPFIELPGAVVAEDTGVAAHYGEPLLEQRVLELERLYVDTEVPRPDTWGGFRVIPSSFEFWQGRSSRLHDRLRFTRADAATWRLERLQP